MSESPRHKHIDALVGVVSNKMDKALNKYEAVENNQCLRVHVTNILVLLETTPTKASEGENFSTNQKHLQQLQLLQRFQLKCYYHDTNMNT
ncbi:MAG: hypothetical protein JWR09_4058 [Mucilaginibacter sp.]|nr:hypothetical protein [Mucilaginibacter sp.]